MDMRTAINLVEEQFSDDIFDAVREEIVSDILNDHEMELAGMLRRYESFHDIESDDFDDPATQPSDPEFRRWLAEQVNDMVGEAAWEIESRVQGDHLIGYRVITAPKTFHYDGSRHPGIYWSWDEGAAEAHWGNFSSGMVEWKFTAKLPVSSIDWKQTLYMSASPMYETEKEVRLFDNAPIEVLSCVPVKGA